MTLVTYLFTGRAVALSSVPAPVFSGAMVAPGTAVDPVRLHGAGFELVAAVGGRVREVIRWCGGIRPW